jgi:hypothetical protein
MGDYQGQIIGRRNGTRRQKIYVGPKELLSGLELTPRDHVCRYDAIHEDKRFLGSRKLMDLFA